MMHLVRKRLFLQPSALIGRLGLCIMALLSAHHVQAEDWKGPPEESVMSVGAMTGLGLIDASSGLALLGTASKKIVNHGFVPDITDSVSIEAVLGPVLLSGENAFTYDVRLRWDFEKDKNWTLYAAGGLGGNNRFNRTEAYIHLAVGAFYKMVGPLNARFELSREGILAGINVPFY